MGDKLVGESSMIRIVAEAMNKVGLLNSSRWLG